jgi:cyclopropane-fatty-acyl-phospholipid synthase
MANDTLRADSPDPELTLVDIQGGFYRRQVLKSLRRIAEGRLTVVENGQRLVFGRECAEEPLEATVEIRDPEAWRQIVIGGSVGVAEAFMDGHWHADDLVSLVRLFVRNREVLDRMETGLARLGAAALRIWHALRRNTRSGSRHNIAAHYDLGNEFFRLFLDESLMYSSAIYRAPTDSLEAAQQRRLERICRKLDLKAGEKLVEIGTGWGGFAIYAARHHGVQVTTTTISRKQYELARERVVAAGLADRVEVLLEDYRDLKGRFDKLVSIEMVEAVGHDYLDTYFAKVSDLLAPHGLGLIQAITIEDHRYARALKEVDFIKRYIFPGSFIPSISAMCAAIARRTDLKLVHLEDIGPSYALTLRAWHERFLSRVAEVRRQGFPEAFVRMWRWYFAYCEGGFRERAIGDVQMLLAKPRNRRTQFLPDLAPSL